MSGRDSAYSPLPQSNSDSDGSSEEEIHVSQENRIINRISKTQNSKTEKPSNAQKQNIINYKLLDTDGDIGVTLLKFQSNADEVSILKPNNSLEIFSTSRKICFIFSVLLCIFTTIVFIWVLPCNVGTCLSALKRNNIKPWEENLVDVEIYGPISVVSNSSDKNLIFLLRNVLVSNEENSFLSEGGVMSLKGFNGAVNWKIKLSREPTDIDCRMLDINLDGYNDCLIIGRHLFKAVDSTSGKELWDIQSANKKKKPYLLDFPLQLPDVDGDEVKDFLTSCSFSDKENYSDVDLQNYLVVVSGKTGIIINDPLQIKLCSAVHNIVIENSSIVSYTCYSTTQKASMKTISLIDVYNTLINISKEKINMNNQKKLIQHNEESTPVHVNGRRLIMENHGHCPEDCSVLVDVKDERENSKNKTVFSYKEKNTYGMTPVIIKLENSSGFVVKFWKWYSKKEKINFQNNVAFPAESTRIFKMEKKEKPMKRNNTLQHSQSLANEMFLETNPSFQRIKRTVNTHRKRKSEDIDKDSSHFNLRVIRETIVAITFNDTHNVVKNVTKDEIIQICKKAQFCQPDFYQQKRSILAVDLDQDGKEEVVSFFTTYVHKEEETKSSNESWRLQSTVRVISL